jgi:hypothetical protein
LFTLANEMVAILHMVTAGNSTGIPSFMLQTSFNHLEREKLFHQE